MEKTTVECVTGIEIAYINWVIEQGGKYENASWTIVKRVCCECLEPNTTFDFSFRDGCFR